MKKRTYQVILVLIAALFVMPTVSGAGWRDTLKEGLSKAVAVKKDPVELLEKHGISNRMDLTKLRRSIPKLENQDLSKFTDDKFFEKIKELYAEFKDLEEDDFIKQNNKQKDSVGRIMSFKKDAAIYLRDRDEAVKIHQSKIDPVDLLARYGYADHSELRKFRGKIPKLDSADLSLFADEEFHKKIMSLYEPIKNKERRDFHKKSYTGGPVISEILEFEKAAAVYLRDRDEGLKLHKTYKDKVASSKKMLGTIKPFGSLDWGDNIFDTIVKLNNIESIKKITIANSDIKASALNVSSKEQLREILTNLVDERRGYLLKDTRGSMLREEYLDINSQKGVILNDGFTVRAEPIILFGIPFEIEIVFKNEKGYAIDQPEKVITTKKWGVSFLMPLTEVVLRSDSEALFDKSDTIKAALKEKYIKFVDTNDLQYKVNGFTGACDEQKNCMRRILGYKDVLIGIEYKSDGYRRKLAKIYKDHLVQLESEKHKNEKDMGLDL